MTLKLSPEQREEIRQLHRSCSKRKFADKLKALPEGHARGPADLFSAGTSPLEYEETPAQAAYTKGKEKELESVTNPMQGFQDIVKAQRTFAPGLYNTFMSYVNGNGRG